MVGGNENKKGCDNMHYQVFPDTSHTIESFSIDDSNAGEFTMPSMFGGKLKTSLPSKRGFVAKSMHSSPQRNFT
jgi:hypothetical protein